MYEIFHNLLKDHDNGVFIFEAFSLCHIVYLLLIIGGIVLALFLSKGKTQEQKKKLIDYTVAAALCLYIADFFLMPFSYGYIDVDKLPFHICTSMSIMCTLARKTKLFAKFKTSFTLMGLVGAVAYMVYPSGVPSTDGYSYRVIQTVLYHGLMIAQGVFAIALKDIDLEWKNVKYDAFAILGLTIWAYLGNTLYSGTLMETCTCIENCPHNLTIYDHDFNWFFVKHDCFYVIPDTIDVYIAPFIMVFGIFGMCCLVRFIGLKVLNAHNKNKE